MFRNRVEELSILEKLYAEKGSNLIILYGRRRVGKTELLNEFARRQKALYLVARQESMQDQLKKISEEVANFFNDAFLKVNSFQNYDALFTYLAEKETPVFFDEFPYLVESCKALPSILQSYWDGNFSKKNVFIVLCGSSVAMMESFLGYKSPLYGRRTEQVLLEPVKFKDSCLFFANLTKEDKVIHYSILGGTPAYLLEFDYSKTLQNNLKEKILRKNKFLFQDTLFVIQQELHEPRIYYSIIKSIAKGNTKLGNIVNDTGLEKGKITKYISILQSLQLIEKRVPITEKSPGKSRKGIYLLKDNYFKFWFKFVFGNISYIEQGKQELLLKNKILPELNAFIGEAYENIILEWLKEQKAFRNYIFGRWWDKNQEIDAVGIDRENNKIIFAEVKWKNLDKKQITQILHNLKKKSEMVKWGINPKKEFIVIGKKIANKKHSEAKVFDLGDIVD